MGSVLNKVDDQLGAWDGAEEGGDKKHRRRVETSAELLHTYRDLYETAEDAQEQHLRRTESREKSLGDICEVGAAYSISVQAVSSGVGVNRVLAKSFRRLRK